MFCLGFRYERLLRRARTEDLTEVSGIGCLYQSGVDRLGRPVVVFCGKWFPSHNIDLEKALLYLIYLLDPIVKGDYVIAYFHTLTSSNNYPSLHWLKEVYSILPYKCVFSRKQQHHQLQTIHFLLTFSLSFQIQEEFKSLLHCAPNILDKGQHSDWLLNCF